MTREKGKGWTRSLDKQSRRWVATGWGRVKGSGRDGRDLRSDFFMDGGMDDMKHMGDGDVLPITGAEQGYVCWIRTGTEGLERRV
jgi:hypothetical protein